MESVEKAVFLIIDDSEIDNNYLELLIDIESIDVNYSICSNGILGLEYLQKCEPEDFPEFILVDINMPLMNGFEFIREYEQQFAQHHPNTKLFVISSTRRLSEIEEARKSDIVIDFIEKPLTKEHFKLFFEKI